LYNEKHTKVILDGERGVLNLKLGKVKNSN